jgi:hypothetical protein
MLQKAWQKQAGNPTFPAFYSIEHSFNQNGKQLE